MVHLVVPTMTSKSQLCASCRRIFDLPLAVANNLSHTYKTGTSNLHHDTAEGCKTSSLEGCPICFTVWTKVTNVWNQATGKDETGLLDLDLKSFSGFSLKNPREIAHPNEPIKKPQCDWLLEISLGSLGRMLNQSDQQVFNNYRVSFAMNEFDSSSPAPTHQVTTEYTGSDESWGLLNSWLKDCLENHSDCTQPESVQGFMPTRLIDVSHHDHTVVSLEENIDPPTPYIALSHCWGKGRNLTLVGTDPCDGTRRISLADARKGFSMDYLPKTYQDAVQATRRLSVRYLWIDSLCILQDSPDDWTAEAKRMQEVYSNALCTFTAAGSSGSSGGMFRQRLPSLVWPIIVTPLWDPLVQKTYEVIPVDFWRQQVTESLTGRRSWILQERLLSPRVVHFGVVQILWECKARECCETYPLGLPGAVLDAFNNFKRLRPEVEGAALRLENSSASEGQIQDRDVEKHADEKGRLDGYYIWARIVETYSRTNITFNKDKLIAIHGIAQHMQPVLDDEYIHGLWSSLLPSQLLWRVEESTFLPVFNIDGRSRNHGKAVGKMAVDENGRVAPSWSWASINGPIVMSTPIEDRSKADIVPVDRTLDDGKVLEDSALLITGDLHLAVFKYLSHWDHWVVLKHPRALRMRPPSHASAKVFPSLPSLIPIPKLNAGAFKKEMVKLKDKANMAEPRRQDILDAIANSALLVNGQAADSTTSFSNKQFQAEGELHSTTSSDGGVLGADSQETNTTSKAPPNTPGSGASRRSSVLEAIKAYPQAIKTYLRTKSADRASSSIANHGLHLPSSDSSNVRPDVPGHPPSRDTNIVLAG